MIGGKKARALRGPVGVDERECKRSEEQDYNVVKNAGQVYHRLGGAGGWEERNSLLESKF